MPSENPTERETAEAVPADLVQEFERIDEEKARLRQLAERLGLRSSRRSESGPDLDARRGSEGGRVFSAAAGAVEPAASTRESPSPDSEAVAASPAPPRARDEPHAGDEPSAGDGPGSGDGPRPEGGARVEARPPASGAARDEGRRAVRRPSRPLPAPRAPGAGTEEGPAARSHVRAASLRPAEAALLETLTGFVPAALYDEVKRERDELFFRLTKLEVERTHVERLRRSLDSMEAEVRRLEEEIQRRRPGGVSGEEAPLRESYCRWLDLRRRRAVRFSDFLACRRSDRDGA